jgi:hypothetical protein
MEKEQWTDQVLESLKGSGSAAPSPFLFTRIQARIDGLKKGASVDLIWVRIAGVTIIALLVLNLAVLKT